MLSFGDQKKLGTYIFSSTLNGMLNHLLNKVPIISGPKNNVFTGLNLGEFNRLEKVNEKRNKNDEI